MNEYELIGRFADLDSRLRKIEGREPIQEQPAPAPAPKLVEAVESVIHRFDQIYNSCVDEGTHLSDRIEAMRPALAREKKRQELVDSLIMGVRNWRNEETAMPYIIRKRSEAPRRLRQPMSS